MIEELPASWLKEDMQISFAKRLLRKDPEAAFNHALSLFTSNPKSFDRTTSIASENGVTSGYSGSTPFRELLGTLVNQDSQRVLAALMPPSSEPSESSFYDNPFLIANRMWAEQDLNAYADWLIEHRSDQHIYSRGVELVAQQLTQNYEFEAAMQWAETLPGREEDGDWQRQNLYRNWLRTDPEGATQWRQSEAFDGNPQHFPLPNSADSDS